MGRAPPPADGSEGPRSPRPHSLVILLSNGSGWGPLREAMGHYRSPQTVIMGVDHHLHEDGLGTKREGPTQTAGGRSRPPPKPPPGTLGRAHRLE